MVSEIKRRRWSGDSVEENSKNCLDKHRGTRRPELRRINNLESLTHQLYRENSGRRKVRRKPSKKKKIRERKKTTETKAKSSPGKKRTTHPRQERKQVSSELRILKSHNSGNQGTPRELSLAMEERDTCRGRHQKPSWHTGNWRTIDLCLQMVGGGGCSAC